MLALIKPGVFKQTWQKLMGVDELPVELDKTCDLVITVGAMGPGHCPP